MNKISITKNRTVTILLIISSILFSAKLMMSQSTKQWYKGQTHAHSNKSDGDSFPRQVVRWYFEHEYNFLVLTDHYTVTDITYLNPYKEQNFILIPGEEVTDTFEKKALHVNAINLKTTVAAKHGSSVVETLQNDIDSIIAAGATTQLNHPNWLWSITADEIIKLKNVKLMEIYNVNRDSNNFSAGGFPGMEEVWDRVLSAGICIYGVATDDTHDYEGEYRIEKAYPGKGWVMVRASELTIEAICDALNKGDFYASTGILLNDLSITSKDYKLEIQQLGNEKYTTQFIGKNGEILKTEFGLTPSYTFKNTEMYVRARVTSTNGVIALTQPVFLKEKSN